MLDPPPCLSPAINTTKVHNSDHTSVKAGKMQSATIIIILCILSSLVIIQMYTKIPTLFQTYHFYQENKFFFPNSHYFIFFFSSKFTFLQKFYRIIVKINNTLDCDKTSRPLKNTLSRHPRKFSRFPRKISLKLPMPPTKIPKWTLSS